MDPAVLPKRCIDFLRSEPLLEGLVRPTDQACKRSNKKHIPAVRNFFAMFECDSVRCSHQSLGLLHSSCPSQSCKKSLTLFTVCSAGLREYRGIQLARMPSCLCGSDKNFKSLMTAQAWVLAAMKFAKAEQFLFDGTLSRVQRVSGLKQLPHVMVGLPGSLRLCAVDRGRARSGERG